MEELDIERPARRSRAGCSISNSSALQEFSQSFPESHAQAMSSVFDDKVPSWTRAE
jgi:hypothetical protein